MDANLAGLCAAIAEAVPDRCALACGSERLSYAGLIARSSQVAQRLIAAGLRQDETGGLYLLNSVAYIELLRSLPGEHRRVQGALPSGLPASVPHTP